MSAAWLHRLPGTTCHSEPDEGLHSKDWHRHGGMCCAWEWTVRGHVHAHVSPTMLLQLAWSRLLQHEMLFNLPIAQLQQSLSPNTQLHMLATHFRHASTQAFIQPRCCILTPH